MSVPLDRIPLGFLSSDVAGRRIQNWIFAHYYFVSNGNGLKIPEVFYTKFLTSIHDQVTHLSQNLTPARNHRTLELYAIFLAAIVFPEFKDAGSWFEFSKVELLKNIQTDLLTDGVHCEQSTDYHHLVLKNYLGIRKLALMNNVEMPAEFDELIKKALEFSLYVHKPDGDIPSLSDGDSRNFLDLLKQGYDLYGDKRMFYGATKGQQGTPPVERSKGFPASGYYTMRSGWGNASEPFEDERYLVFDCGPLGRGNHGHLDLLSFEMAAYGRSLIVDPGRYTYDESGDTNWRVKFRGTGYHNTVQIDGMNQTRYEFHKTRFKIRGAEPDWLLKRRINETEYDYLHGIARSYEYDVVHERKIFFVCPEYWIITDVLNAEEEHNYDLFFHLSDHAQDCISTSVDDHTATVRTPNLVIAQIEEPQIILSLEEGYISRTYGTKHRAPIIRFSQQARAAMFNTIIFPYKSEIPSISVETLKVLNNPWISRDPRAYAICTTIKLNGEIVHDYYFISNSESGTKDSFKEFIYDGSFLFLRTDSCGKITRLHVEDGATLLDSNGEVYSKGSVVS